MSTPNIEIGRTSDQTKTTIGAATIEASAVEERAHRPRLGFLGIGWIGRHRMECIRASRAADIVMLADQNVDMAKSAAKELELTDAHIANSLDELLDAELDGIVIATPSALHADQAVAALERGVAVFCQKPLARTADETQRVVHAARTNDRLLGVDLSYRHTEGMRRIRPIVQNGELGEIYAVDLVFHNAYGPDKAWFFDPVLSGGGCVIDLGIHLVDLALWTLGNPRVDGATSRLYSQGKRVLSSKNVVEDFAQARLDLATGCGVQLSCSWNLSAGRDAVIGAAFYGARGGVALRNVNGSFFDFVAERYRGTACEVLASPPDDWGGRAATEWTRRLAAGDRYDAHIEQIVDVARALDRIYER